ncbi:universal stress protein [Sediminibacterium soli]|uniref:universal stress protein n=1 Tax=Sediminibacterium soli TaxID=2698829 RepID=UPI00137A4AD4|nr:universal stress protein [Sediminibacterium soli]NCI47522.1 universal stress protein [Sediminibacterium soli]
MDTLLLPTDFSATAQNAARYALQLAEQLSVKKIVLYHSYEIPVTIDPMVPGIQMLEVDTLKEESEHGLAKFRSDLLPFSKNVLIEIFNEYGDLAEGLDDVCNKVKADIVVMGITGGGALEEKLIGSNAVSVAKHTHTPVIIVPAGCSFTRIEEIMLTSDFDRKDSKVPVELVRKIVQETKAKLFVFAIEDDPEEYEDDTTHSAEDYALHRLLNDLSPEFHFSENANFTEAVNDFASEYGIDLVITIAKKQGFFGSLFSESHTKQLAFHSQVPVMVIHE